VEHVKERTIAAGEAQLHVYEWGEQGRPVLFWHALGDHTALQPIDVAPTLVAQYGARLIAADAPGFGGSPRLPDERYEMPALVELAARLADELALEEFAWLGSSWGAGIGVHFAATHPERLTGLALLDGGYFNPDWEGSTALEDLREHWRGHPEYFRFDSWDAVIEDARAAFTHWTPGIEQVVRSAHRETEGEVASIMGPDVYAAAMHGLHAAPPTRELARLGQTGVPVLVLAATEPTERAELRRPELERFEELVPAAEIHRVPNACHLMLEDAPEEVARAVGEWLARLDRPAR
jgi:pimeloyl-ACP methyl ester carboxylesterase